MTSRCVILVPNIRMNLTLTVVWALTSTTFRSGTVEMIKFHLEPVVFYVLLSFLLIHLYFYCETPCLTLVISAAFNFSHLRL